MDVNAKSELVWNFYEETLARVSSFGCKILRLDAFAYLHKEVGQTNFFNKPGTWDYLERINQIAKKNDLILLPEIHSEYGSNLHDEVAKENYPIYDFFLPGLVIHTLETGNNKALLRWINEIISKGYSTVNMLGCHDEYLRPHQKSLLCHSALISPEEQEALESAIRARSQQNVRQSDCPEQTL